jgi:hypothetical protein
VVTSFHNDQQGQEKSDTTVLNGLFGQKDVGIFYQSLSQVIKRISSNEAGLGHLYGIVL